MAPKDKERSWYQQMFGDYRRQRIHHGTEDAQELNKALDDMCELTASDRLRWARAHPWFEESTPFGYKVGGTYMLMEDFMRGPVVIYTYMCSQRIEMYDVDSHKIYYYNYPSRELRTLWKKVYWQIDGEAFLQRLTNELKTMGVDGDKDSEMMCKGRTPSLPWYRRFFGWLQKTLWTG